MKEILIIKNFDITFFKNDDSLKYIAVILKDLTQKRH